MTFTYDGATMAKASLRDATISFKKSLMVAQALRGMMSDKASAYLERVIAQRQPVPFTKFMNGAGHRRGPLAAGKYPLKAAEAFLALTKAGVANAENKGLGTPLRIVHLVVNESSRPMHAGRQRGRVMKRTRVDLVLAETEESKKREKKAKKEKAPKKEKTTKDDGKSERMAAKDAPKPTESVVVAPAVKPGGAEKDDRVVASVETPKPSIKATLAKPAKRGTSTSTPKPAKEVTQDGN